VTTSSCIIASLLPYFIIYHIGGVMVSVLAVDRWVDPRSDQTKNYEIGICYKNIHCIPSTPCIECKCDPCVCCLSICDCYSALENETLYFKHLFQCYNNRVIISNQNKPLNFIIPQQFKHTIHNK
jgi:hypothetical protein